MKQLTFFIFILLMISTACEELPVDTIYYDFGNSRGVFISNEGNFMYGNSSLTYYDKEKKKAFNQVFYARNNAPLGDVAQSLAFNGKTLFIMVNNSGRIYGIDPETAAYKGVITGLVSPRYMHFLNAEKAYVSDLYARKIWIVNPEKYTLSGSITLSDGSTNSARHASEQFLKVGNLIYVSCWSYDDYLLVIDPSADEVIDSIKVPLQPRDMVYDRFGKVWVLSDGGYEGSPAGFENPALSRIDPETRTIERIFRYRREEGIPSGLVLNRTSDTLLYIQQGIRQMAVKGTVLPGTAFIPPEGRLFFSLAIDPDTGEIYAADAIDYSQSGVVYRYSPGGKLVDSFRAGINPGAYWFN